MAVPNATALLALSEFSVEYDFDFVHTRYVALRRAGRSERFSRRSH